ncbi:NADH-quinone oxidoreductase subunit J [Geminicoccus harenae]|uniref:NADH-quinone oxidoreductase subunit J n=1 Tax=Geminicoccus harenae TaxID=2498453 RepID=UPI00168AF867|nr:NADH-quinone oxidoreductase subunit J [Geminicoccus harenae]
MTIELALFYLLSAVTVGCAVMVIASRNPVHSVLFLILAFFNSAGLFLLLGAEFLAMILVVVYVGAVAVLFLFVVMMLDVNFRRLREGARLYWPIGALVGVILLAELILVTGGWAFAGGFETAAPIPSDPSITNTEALGRVIYTDYVYLFQTAGVILLVAIIGAIMLTLRPRGTLRRQDIAEQVHRRPQDTVELRKVDTGAGV